ncbi:hypothetical protein ZWY2020_028038 [Hordeum vulgare]|nr:hypothetical protein ZWY2020_028038 [Hordeum vulgare]
MNKNLGKRAAKGGAEDPRQKQPHVSEGPNSGDDDFVLADFVRDVNMARVESVGIHASGDVGLGQCMYPRVGACDVHKDFYNGSEKDEDLDDASSPPDVVVDKPRDENVEVRQLFGVVHVDAKQGGCVVARGDDVNASLSVVVDSAEPSLSQESLHAIAPSQHEDADVDIEKQVENCVPVDSVVGSWLCLASNVVPDVFRVE